MLINYVLLQIEVISEAISKFGLLTVLLAGIGMWVHRLVTNDEAAKKQHLERLMQMLDKYEIKLNEHDTFKENTIKELIVLLKENHIIMRENNEINREVIRILSILSNSTRNSHSL